LCSFRVISPPLRPFSLITQAALDVVARHPHILFCRAHRGSTARAPSFSSTPFTFLSYPTIISRGFPLPRPSRTTAEFAGSVPPRDERRSLPFSSEAFLASEESRQLLWAAPLPQPFLVGVLFRERALAVPFRDPLPVPPPFAPAFVRVFFLESFPTVFFLWLSIEARSYLPKSELLNANFFAILSPFSFFDLDLIPAFLFSK